MERTRIILDADVIIHFAKAGYCIKHQLTYLTTIDFLYYAIRNGVITIDQAFQFVKDVVAKGSKLPYTDFDTYVSGVVI